MSRIVDYRDSGSACWARFQMTNSDPCWLSVTPQSVLVKRSRVGLLGRRLYKADGMMPAIHATVLDREQPEGQLPEGMTELLLRVFTRTILNSDSAEEVADVLNHVAERLEESSDHFRPL